MYSSPTPTVLVVGRSKLKAGITAGYLQAKCDATVVDCGTDLTRVIGSLNTFPVDAVVALSDGDGAFPSDDLDALVDAASARSARVLLLGVSSSRRRRLGGTRGGTLWSVADGAPTDRLWELLEVWIGPGGSGLGAPSRPRSG